MISVISRVFLAIPIIIAISFQESNASDFDISAFGTLNELSVRAANERMLVSNVLFVGAGVGAVAAIGLHIEGEYKTASFLSVTSAAALGGGVLARHFETSTERALARVLMIEDPSERAVKQLQNRNNQQAWLNNLDWQVAFNGGANQQLAFGLRF